MNLNGLGNSTIIKPDSGIVMESTILLIGQTGAGKSQFIRVAIGSPSKEQRLPYVGHGVISETKEVEAFQANNPNYPGSSVCLIDTPGFNDSDGKGDDKSIRKIIQWLKEEPNARINGILYLHEITQIRGIQADIVKPENIPQPPGSFMVTTKWSSPAKAPSRRAEESREQALQKELDLPSKSVYRFDNTSKSAWEIIAAVQALPANVTRKKLAQKLEIICPQFRVKEPDGSFMKRLAKLFRNMFK